MMDDAEGGLENVRKGYDMWCGTGAKIHVPFWLSLFAEIFEKNSRTEEGLQAIRQALAESDRTGEMCWRSDIHRLHGRVLHQAGDTSTAMVELDTAIDLARRQDAKWFELRAIRDRSILMHQLGETERAASALEPIYASFTEGHDMIDLKESRLLLKALQT